MQRILLSNISTTTHEDIQGIAPPISAFFQKADLNLKARGIDIQLADGAAYRKGSAKLAQIKEQYYIYNVAHELGHAFGMQHHNIAQVEALGDAPCSDGTCNR